MDDLAAAVERWGQLRKPPGRWRHLSRAAMRAALLGLPLDTMTEALVLKHVDGAYPFGERAMYPYKAWLVERKLLIETLRGPLQMPTKDEGDVCDVARDLVEERRIDEASALLEAQAPNRLNRCCPACGVAIGRLCREPYADSTDHSGHGDYGMRELLVPHAARLVGRLDTGPLFATHNEPSLDDEGA